MELVPNDHNSGNHAASLLASLNLQREQAQFCDCMLRVLHNPDQLYPAHRCVLAASSPVWVSLLSSAGALVELKASCLSDIVLVHVLDYIYTGALPMDRDQQEWSAMLAAASYLQMDGLLEELQTKVKSADSIWTARREHQPCEPDNGTEDHVEDMSQNLSSTCSVKRENLHSKEVSLCGGFERRSCCENADLGVSRTSAGGCTQGHAKTPRNIIQSISTMAAWHRPSEEEDGFLSADSWHMSKDKFPREAENGRSLRGKDEDGNLPQDARETGDPWTSRSKDLNGTTQNNSEDHQRGQHHFSTLQPAENFPISSMLFDKTSSSTTSQPCSGAVPVIRHSSTASLSLAAWQAARLSKVLPSGSRDKDQNAEGSNHLKAEDLVVNKQDELPDCQTGSLAQEDALHKADRQDYSYCDEVNNKYRDRLDLTDDHIDCGDSVQDALQHFRTDSIDHQLQSTNCRVLTATTRENPSGHPPDTPSVVQSPSQESGSGSFSHDETFGPEKEMMERLSDSQRSPVTVCDQPADADVDATADTVRKSLELGNISEQRSTCATCVDKKSDVDSGFVAHSYHGRIHYHCLSPVGPHFHPRHSYQQSKPWSQAGDEQESGLIPGPAPSPPGQPFASAEQVVLLDISTKSPELLVSCTPDKSGPRLAFAQKDTLRRGLGNAAGQNTATGGWKSENPPPALTVCSSPGVPDYVKASASSTLSVRMPSAMPAIVPTNVSEQLSPALCHPFQCSVCERSFSQRGSLNRHVRSHLGIRPFPCPRCPMTFSRQYRVTEHMRVHGCFVPERSFPKSSAPPI